jgi:hypothetical protein
MPRFTAVEDGEVISIQAAPGPAVAPVSVTPRATTSVVVMNVGS